MPALNIFKVFPAQIENLGNYLQENGLEFIQQTERDFEGKWFVLKLYFNRDARAAPIKWISDLAKNFDVGERSVPHYAAAVLIAFEGEVLAISFGFAHVYISRFADLDFGIDVACRLLSSFKIKSSREIAGNRLRSIDTYRLMAELPFEPGEAVDYIRGVPEDVVAWGRNVSCGHSVHLRHRRFNVASCHLVCEGLSRILHNPPNKEIPRRQLVNSDEEVEGLDLKLGQAIAMGQLMADVGEVQLSGVALMFPEDREYWIVTPRGVLPLDGEDGLGVLQNVMLRDFNGDCGELFAAEVIAQDDDGNRKFYSLKSVLDYKDIDGYYLEGGAWYKFDLAYLNNIRVEVDKIELSLSNEMPLFDEAGYLAWKAKQQVGVRYPEHYLNSKLANEFGYLSLDRQLFPVDGAGVEVADLYRDETIFIVKIGKPQKHKLCS